MESDERDIEKEGERERKREIEVGKQLLWRDDMPSTLREPT